MMKNKNGFTLIETILYILLFSVIIVGGMAGAYQIISGTDSTSSKTVLEQEASFILRKMDWALTGATALSITACTPQPCLEIIRSPSSVVFTLNGTNFQKDGIGLNSPRIVISNLLFQSIAIGTKQGVLASFTASTFDGKLNQTFSMTKYLRQ